MPRDLFQPLLARLLEDAASLDVLACRQVWAGFFRIGGGCDATVVAQLDASGVDDAFAKLLDAARSLCPLEALAHRTAEVESALALARALFLEAEAGASPLSFPVPLRIFAGVALAQRTWLEEVCYLGVPLPERVALLPESPALEPGVLRMISKPSDTHHWRLFCALHAAIGDTVTLSEDEHHYAFHVLRLAAGDTVELGDGKGWLCRGQLERCDKKGATVRVESVARARVFATRVHLFLAMPKPATLEDVVAQAAEMGVARIVVFRSAKAQSKAPLKKEKLERLALESLRVTKGFFSPEIAVHESLDALLFDAFASFTASGSGPAHGLFLCDESPLHDADAGRHNGLHNQLQTLAAAYPGNVADVGLVVGPESSFTAQEREAILQAGATPVSLGPLVFRVPTAAAAAIALAMGAFNADWKNA